MKEEYIGRTQTERILLDILFELKTLNKNIKKDESKRVEIKKKKEVK